MSEAHGIRSDADDALVPPCRASCPVDHDVPRFLRAVAANDTETAWKIALRDNLFPGVLSRICPRPCEAACRRAPADPPVPICELKQWVCETEGRGRRPGPVASSDGPRVAIIGAGPAGLAAAHDLVLLGARPTLFDRLSHPGGLLSSCIPGFRLPESVVESDVDRILSLGVPFEPDRSFDDADAVRGLLSDGYAAVLLAPGAGDDEVPALRGWRDGPSTLTALTFLSSLGGRNNGGPSWKGRRVLVIGGGNAAMDAARAARRRHGRVTVLYRRDWADMSALPREIEEAMADGVIFRTLTLPTEVLWRDGKLAGLRAVSTRVDGAGLQGRREVIPCQGTEHVHEADVVVSAIGQTHPLRGAMRIEAAPVTARGVGLASDGVFACGDFVTGPSTVAEAIASGRRAATALRDHLERTGARLAPGWAAPVTIPERRADPLPGRVLSAESAAEAAEACLRCDNHLALRAERCVLCSECVVRCARDAIRWLRTETGAYRLIVNDSTCIRCGDCVAACPAGAIHWSLWTSRNRNIDLRIALSV